ncbi:MAG: hypothetical protein MK207_05790 [Saprospiraceae bacterium]|nr:hypothetical protein [Saprospiraceae bacterium]
MNTFKSLIQLCFIIIIVTACSKKECTLKSKYIYEPLVFDEVCNCIVAGKVKYLKDCETAVLVDYGNGTCDNIATKTICINGKCELSAGAYNEEIQFECQESFIEGPITEEEATRIGI